MDFTMASQLKAGKIAKDARAATQTTVQKGTGDKPKVGADAISVTKATSAPKAATTIQQAHRGDARTAPKVADFTQDRRAEAGEFESSAAPSTADTATHRQDRVGKSLAKENNLFICVVVNLWFFFPSKGELQAGEFESAAAASKADTATYRADRVGKC